MPEFQTSVQSLGAVLRGSAKVEISPYLATPSWVDAGALSGIEVDEKLETNKEENDNADADELVTSQEPAIKAVLHEFLRSAIWDILRSGFDTKTTVAGTLVEDHSQVVASGDWAYDSFIELTGQNDSGVKQTIASVTGGTDGVLVLNTDYFQGKNAAGKWGIYVRDSTTVTTQAQALTIVYDYTPTASVKYVSGDKTVLPWFMLRITTKNDGATYYSVLYKCKIKAGKKWSYPKDDDKDRRVKCPIEIVAKPDALYHSGLVYETVQTGGF
jgi:hypothetical protein